MFVLSSRKYIEKVFSVFGHACKSIFSKNIFLCLTPQCKTFYRNMPKKYTYNTIEDLKIPIHIIYPHPLQNSNHKKYEHIHIQVLHNNDRGTHIHTTFMVIHPSLDVPFY